MLKETWIRFFRRPTLNEPIAIVGSPGLRSIGKLVINLLIKKIKAELLAELYSIHFPLIYQTQPSYASHPRFPGISGIRIESGKIDLPKVTFYSYSSPPLIITQGCHANFNGQYEVAEKVLDFYNEFGVRRMIVLAGYGLKGEKVCCAATSHKIIETTKEKYGINVGYEGPFYGFSGIVFGLAKLRGMEALCLFANTKPIPEDPENPDHQAAITLLNKVTQILNLTIENTAIRERS